MKKAIVLLIAIFMTTSIHAQIDKGYWLLAGSGSYSRHTVKKPHTSIETLLVFTPRIGYFLIDNLASGLVVDWETYTVQSGVSMSKQKITQFKAGPFIRYYFLKTNTPLNLFAEGNISFGKFDQKNVHDADIMQFMFAAGPVLYFNSSIALELSMGYRSMEIKSSTGSEKKQSVLFSIGFNVHLIKDK
jgi:hypothetical protein